MKVLSQFGGWLGESHRNKDNLSPAGIGVGLRLAIFFLGGSLAPILYELCKDSISEYLPDLKIERRHLFP